jgi:predicted membrane metal-binding protein
VENERAPVWLAIARIVSVLGMSFAIALGIFLLLGGWWQPGLIALAASVPFFMLMRYMEKRALREQ